MPPLSTFPLPLPANGPSAGYGWAEREVSLLSVTSAFETGIDRRDMFLGQRRCVICGSESRATLEHCHIIRVSEPHIWTMLKQRRWIPRQAKNHPEHEPRDGLLMCSNHHRNFDAYDFLIRYSPDTRKYVFINYSGENVLQQYHGRAIALNIDDRYAPFPSLFIIHEMRVRGFHPFQPTAPAIADNPPWQNWILSDGVLDHTTNSFIRDRPAEDGGDDGGEEQQQSPPPPPQPTTSAGGNNRTVALNDNVVAEILAATRATPSWRACEIEGMSWSGTAEENIRKYAALTGTQLG